MVEQWKFEKFPNVIQEESILKAGEKRSAFDKISAARRTFYLGIGRLNSANTPRIQFTNKLFRG